MFIAWYWIVLIALVVVGYFLHLKRYCRAFRQDRDALLEAQKLSMCWTTSDVVFNQFPPFVAALN